MDVKHTTSSRLPRSKRKKLRKEEYKERRRQRRPDKRKEKKVIKQLERHNFLASMDDGIFLFVIKCILRREEDICPERTESEARTSEKRECVPRPRF